MRHFIGKSAVILLMIASGMLTSNSGAFAQNTVYTKDNMHDLPDIVTQDTRVTDMKYKTKLLGSNYFSEEWMDADIHFSGDTIELQDVSVRMDVANGVVEIQAKDNVRIIPSYKTDRLYLRDTDELFYSRSGINLYGPAGFYKSLYEGKSALYCHFSTKVKESNYNVALDAGRMDDELVLTKTYYLARSGKLIKLEKKKSKIVEQLQGGSDLLGYMKENSIDVKKESGLIQIVSYLDEGKE